MKLEKVSNDNLWNLYSQVLRELKKRKQIRTKNITGERGEYLAVKFFNESPKLSKLQHAPVGTQSVDALSKSGERYAIKAITKPNKTTGVFYGLGEPDSEVSDRIFEYLLVVELSEFYELERLLRISWGVFYKHKKWHSRMKAYNISLTSKLVDESEVLYKAT